MVNLLRKYQKPLMIVITVVICIAFAWLYNRTNLDRIHPETHWRVYGKSYPQSRLEQMAPRIQIANQLGMRELLEGLVGASSGGNEALVNDYIWNTFVLRHEADVLGIAPSDEQVVDAIKTMPAMQTGTTFDPDRYAAITAQLGRAGLTSSDFEELVRDELRIRALVELVGAPLNVTPAEFRALYARFKQKMQVSLVRFHLAEFAAAIPVNAEEIQKYFEAHKGNLVTEETRAVSFARLGLSEAEAKLTGKEKVDALQRLSDQAADLGQALLDPNADFAKTVAAKGLKVESTPEFPPSAPSAAFENAPEAAQEAFKIDEKNRVSNTVQVGNAFYLLHLDKITPSRPLTLEEATPRITAAIQKERGQSALVAKAAETHKKLAELLQAGKPFAEAVAEAGAKVETFPAFSASEPPREHPEIGGLLEKLVDMREGALSEVLQGGEGALIAHMDQREPLDEAKMAEEQKMVEPMVLRQKRLIAFHGWLAARRNLAGIQAVVPRSVNPRGQE